MKGAHRIIVETKKIKYDFTVKRNITILTGNSGSGKTTEDMEVTAEFWFRVTVSVKFWIMRIGNDSCRKVQAVLFL